MLVSHKGFSINQFNNHHLLYYISTLRVVRRLYGSFSFFRIRIEAEMLKLNIGNAHFKIDSKEDS